MKGVDKHPIVVNEGAGFVVNRILIPEINEAIGIYADNIASPSDIDRAMQLGAGMKVGPLHTADLVVWTTFCPTYPTCMKKPAIRNIIRIRCCVRWFALACSVRSPAADSLRTSIRLVRKFLAAS